MEAPTGVIPVDQIAAALGYASEPADQPQPLAPRRAGAPSFPARLTAWLRRARLLAPVAVLVVALLIILTIAGVFSSGSHKAPSQSSSPPTGLSGTATIPATTPAPHSTAAHRARLRAAKRRREARARAKAAAAAAAAAAKLKLGTTRTGAAATGSPTTAAGPATTPTTPANRAPGQVVASPATTVPPNNGAAPAVARGYVGN